MRTKQVLVILVPLALICTAAWAGLKSIPASLGYSVEAEFDEFPPNDRALEDWLRSQPRVASVHVGQRDGEPNTLVVWFIQVRNGWGNPPLPDLNDKCDELGYKGRKNGFRDSDRRTGDSIRPRETPERKGKDDKR